MCELYNILQDRKIIMSLVKAYLKIPIFCPEAVSEIATRLVGLVGKSISRNSNQAHLYYNCCFMMCYFNAMFQELKIIFTLLPDRAI